MNQYSFGTVPWPEPFGGFDRYWKNKDMPYITREGQRTCHICIKCKYGILGSHIEIDNSIGTKKCMNCHNEEERKECKGRATNVTRSEYDMLVLEISDLRKELNELKKRKYNEL